MAQLSHLARIHNIRLDKYWPGMLDYHLDRPAHTFQGNVPFGGSGRLRAPLVSLSPEPSG